MALGSIQFSGLASGLPPDIVDQLMEEPMFDIHQTPTDEYGEWDEGAVEDYCTGLMEKFADSSEGDAAAKYYGEIGWAYSFLDYGFPTFLEMPEIGLPERKYPMPVYVHDHYSRCAMSSQRGLCQNVRSIVRQHPRALW